MRKIFTLLTVITFLLMPSGYLWATINQVDCGAAPCRMCGGVLTLTPGVSGTVLVQGVGVDLTTGLTVSNSSALSSPTIVERLNGFQNQAAGGRLEWGRLKISVTASASAVAGSYAVYINYLAGRDTLPVKVLPKANITGATVPTFSGPFQSNVDVKLTGTSLSGATSVTATILRDSFTPLLDSGGQDAPAGVTVSAAVDTASNTATEALVRLNFSIRLTKATLKLALSSNSACNSLYSGASYTLTLSAPVSGPSYVKDHLFNPTTLRYGIGTTVTVTIRLDRPVGKGLTALNRLTGLVTGPGVVYWAVIPSNAIKQAGTTGTPYDPNARFNTITIPEGQQSKTITFTVAACTSGGTSNTVKFITWKPDPNVDTSPNRKETNFIIVCTP